MASLALSTGLTPADAMDETQHTDGPDDPSPSEALPSSPPEPFAKDRDAQAATEVPSKEVASPFSGDGRPDQVDEWIDKQLQQSAAELDRLREQYVVNWSATDGKPPPDLGATTKEESEYPLPPPALDQPEGEDASRSEPPVEPPTPA
jgi:hypothetical protein